MRQRMWKTGLLIALLAVTGGMVAAAAEEEAPSEATGQLSAWNDFWDTFHNPTPWLSMGMDHRFRSVWGENIVMLNDDHPDHEWEYQRYRTRWWTKWILGENVDFNTRLTWEFRTWDEPRKNDVEMDCDEALFDHFNISMRNIGGLPLTATVGRQDIIMGSAWLVLDASPLDGSRTIYFDAARFTYDWAETNTKVDLIYVDQAAESDRWLKPLSDENRGVTEQDEHGLILWLTNKSVENTQLEGFFIYKNDNPVEHVLSNFSPTWSRKAEIFTFGGAISGTPGENWKYRVDGAIQTGDKYTGTSDLSIGQKEDLQAYGLLSDLEYMCNDPLDNRFHIGYEYASGDDDPNDNDNGQFDLLWGEWPRWSELYIYTVIPEGSVAEISNLHRANVGHKFRPNKQWQICTDFHYIWADENTGMGFSDGSGKTRGQLITCWAKYQFSKQLKGHLLGEYFFPGNFYADTNNDEAFFLRFNLEYTF